MREGFCGRFISLWQTQCGGVSLGISLLSALDTLLQRGLCSTGYVFIPFPFALETLRSCLRSHFCALCSSDPDATRLCHQLTHFRFEDPNMACFVYRFYPSALGTLIHDMASVM